MIGKVLVANRGEIACRIFRTLKEMNISTVAVYSNVDKHAMHVAMADESISIGHAPAAESYLDIKKIIKAARQCDADAVHPGYGFLSENAAFVHALNDADIQFIGPGADAIEAMGLKDAAKTLMEESGVPVVPGYHGTNQDAGFLAEQAEKIGYPILIKARAGGGGKGMRKVERPAEFHEALAGAQREGQSSFADASVLIEKYISTPRHIEIQIFGDSHGDVVHLFERDCSLQRRHQKVIEEAPAPGMTNKLRSSMGEAAIKAAKAVNYVGAGTVEFIVDASNGLKPDGFYFMEMNTRLQVEHPVTELITGIDLVAWQIDIANGKPLPLKQEQLNISGHAFEARIYAEDIDNGFLPATGRLQHMQLDESARIDTGVQQNDVITPFYDPMIAKLIVHGEDRNAALKKLSTSLGRSRIVGCTTNIDFLTRLSMLPRFVKGEVETGLIEQELGKLLRSQKIPEAAQAVATMWRSGIINPGNHGSPWKTLGPWRQWGTARQTVVTNCNSQEMLIEIDSMGSKTVRIKLQDQWLNIDIVEAGVNGCKLKIDNLPIDIAFFAQANQIDVFFPYETFSFVFDDPLESSDSLSGDGNNIAAPMPGSITRVEVSQGDEVKKDQLLLVMEAMKMEHSLRSMRDGIIESINVNEGDQIESGTILISLKT